MGTVREFILIPIYHTIVTSFILTSHTVVDQFLHSNLNTRSDEYSGSVENRCKFPLELTEALADAIGASNVGIRLEPAGLYQQTRGDKRVETWSYLCNELARRYRGDERLSYVHFIEPRFDRIDSDAEKKVFYKSWNLSKVSNAPFRDIMKDTPCFSCGDWDETTCTQAVDSGDYDAVVFARLFVSNPDLPER